MILLTLIVTENLHKSSPTQLFYYNFTSCIWTVQDIGETLFTLRLHVGAVNSSGFEIRANILVRTSRMCVIHVVGM